MKLLTVNICPPDKCAKHLKKTLTDLGPENRTEKIIGLIRTQNPDVIFFVEQWYPVYSLVKSELESDYRFVLPEDFNPASSYAGVVAAIKSNIDVTSSAGGKEYVEKDGKWLSLEIDGHIYLGVHYPQPRDEKKLDTNFHQGVMEFVKSKEPLVILGDFNTPRSMGAVTIDGYQDLLPEKEPTSAFGTKLDYIFLPDNYCGAKAELIQSAMQGETAFSDHCATMLTL